MLKIFRLPGFIAFVVISAAVFAGGYFFADSAVKSGLESSLQSAAGAQVDIDKVDIQFSPFALNIEQLEIANPDKLTENAIQFQSASIKVDWLKWFQGKTIIDTIEVSGAALNQIRSKPAKAIKIEKKDTEEDTGPSAIDKVKSNLPSASEILANEDIKSIEQAKALEQLIKDRIKQVDEGFKNLPTDKQIETLSKRLDLVLNTKIDSLDKLKTQANELKDISLQAGLYKKAFIDQRKLIENSQAEIKQGLADLKQQSVDDLNGLKEKYSLDSGGLVNLTQSLFGDQYSGYLDQAIVWYDKISPYLGGSDDAEKEAEKQRLLGRYVDFKSDQPLPEFLLANLLMQLELKGQAYELKANHITNDQTAMNKITPFSLSKTVLSKNEKFVVKGYSDRIDKNHDFLELDISGIEFDGRQLFKQDSMALNLSPSKGSIKGKLVLTKGVLDGSIKWGFDQTSFEVLGDGTMATQLRSALGNIQNFDIQIKISGKLKDLKIEVSSDLDGKVGEQIKLLINQKKDEVTNKIQLAVTEKINEIKQPAVELQSKLKDQEKEFERKQDQFNEEVQTKLDEAEQKGKDKLSSLEDEAKALLDAKKAELEAEKKRLEALAQEKADKLKAEAEAEKQRIQAQADKVKAEAEAEKQRLLDEAEAEKKRIQAETDKLKAEAEAEKKRLQAIADAEKKAAEDKAKKEAADKLKKFF
ncbi:TIGR03545 family protein [Marinicellulosiphila megalodicopiae]|uniref:TIGR03545 family protein n=1 Tax=Marinicellulosiphila megalodicopiae TaxID=2724896 RepID=UPI003BB16A9B